MKRLYFCIAFIAIHSFLFGQSSFTPTDSFRIFGLVEKNTTITLPELQKMGKLTLDSFSVINHKGETKKVYKKIQGVPLIEVLKNVTIKAENPKILSEYYLIAKASDGYSVVISWNELFNSALSKSFLLVTDVDNSKPEQFQERILLIATKDVFTGRRHVKGLTSLEIKRI